MIRWYRSEYVGTGTFFDPFRSPLEDIIDMTKLVFVDGLNDPARRIWYQIVQCPQGEHDKIIKDGRMVPITPLFSSTDEKTYLNNENEELIKEGTAQIEKDGIDLSWVKAETKPKEVLGYLWKCLIAAGIAKGNEALKNTALSDLTLRSVTIKGETY